MKAAEAYQLKEDDGLIFAAILDGRGGARFLDWADLMAWRPEQGVLWVHLNRRVERAEQWISSFPGLDQVVVEALLAEDTRPRATVIGGRAIVILRGVNLNPGQDPDDMVSVRLWIGADVIISTRRQPLMAIQDMRLRLDRGEGPRTPGEILTHLALRLTDRMAPVLDEMEERLDDMEQEVAEDRHGEDQPHLAPLRRQAIRLKRYLAPQRDALKKLLMEEVAWIAKPDRLRLREATDRVTRIVEDLDAIRERCAVIQDEIMNHLSVRINRIIFVLTLLTAVLLPLSFVTGLLGVNLSGIPGADSPWAFAGLCALLAIISGAEIWLFKKLRWF